MQFEDTGSPSSKSRESNENVIDMASEQNLSHGKSMGNKTHNDTPRKPLPGGSLAMTHLALRE